MQLIVRNIREAFAARECAIGMIRWYVLEVIVYTCRVKAIYKIPKTTRKDNDPHNMQTGLAGSYYNSMSLSTFLLRTVNTAVFMTVIGKYTKLSLNIYLEIYIYRKNKYIQVYD